MYREMRSYLGCLRLPGACRSGGSPAHDEVEGLGEGDVAPVSEGRDDQPGGVAQVLVLEHELGVADLHMAVLASLVPPEHPVIRGGRV